MKVRKIAGEDNPADLLTKHLAVQLLNWHMEALCIDLRMDRAETAPQLNALMDVESDNDEGKADEWKGGNEEFIRHHRRPRRCLFSPLRVKGSPPAKSLTPVRITEGQYLDDGEYFARTETWTARSTAHLVMSRPWTGTTKFLARTEQVK